MNRLTLVTLVLSLGTAVSACGDDDAAPSAPEDFPAQADAICEQVNRENPPPTEPPRNAQDAIALEADEIEVRQDLDSRLQELQPPADLQATFDDYNEQTAEIINLGEEARQAAEDNDEDQYGETQQQRLEAQQSREQTAEELGFEVCGRQTEAPPEEPPPGETQPEPAPPDDG